MCKYTSTEVSIGNTFFKVNYESEWLETLIVAVHSYFSFFLSFFHSVSFFSFFLYFSPDLFVYVFASLLAYSFVCVCMLVCLFTT